MISKLQEKMNSYQRVWAEIDLDAIWENMIHMKENIAPETKILAVIKTDGYGHGGVPIARMLEDVDFMFGYGGSYLRGGTCPQGSQCEETDPDPGIYFSLLL